MEIRSVTQDMVRSAIRSFCQGGRRVSNAQLYELMGLKEGPERDRFRTRISDLIRFGEVIKVAPGMYEYNFKHRSRANTSFPKIWRFVRTQRPGWSISYASQLTNFSYTQVLRYCNWLENEGFIERHGKEGTTILYRATEKADRTPETPYPDMADRNPFERERAAAARLATVMICCDPSQPTTARKIVTACKILLARFEKGVTQLENEEGENE